MRGRLMQDHHSDEKQERLKEKLRDELGTVICGLLDQSSGIEDILVNEDCRIWVKRTGSAFEQIGELDSRQARGAMMTIASPSGSTALPGWLSRLFRRRRLRFASSRTRSGVSETFSGKAS